jgi:hypothetical protein
MHGQQNDRYTEMNGQQNDKYTDMHGQQNDRYTEMHGQQNDKYTEMHGKQNVKRKILISHRSACFVSCNNILITVTLGFGFQKDYRIFLSES